MTAATAPTAEVRRAAPDLRRRRRPGERVIETVLLLCGLVSVATTLGIVWILASNAFDFFRRFSALDFLTGTTWQPKGSPQLFGVLPLLGGTLLVALVAIVVAVPLGLGAATYLSEYARPRVRRVLKPLLEILAGVPTVVYGYFALRTVTPLLQQVLGGSEVSIFNALSAGIVMGIMIVPTVASLSEDAMRAVPQSLREGAYGLGAGRRRVATRVVIPSALSGIAASVILGISRAVGETMIVAIAAGSTPNLTFDVREPIQTMTGYIAQVALGDSQQGTVDYQSIFAVGFTLFVLTLLLNMLSQRFVRRFRQVYQ